MVRSGDLISYCAEEGVRILGEGKFLVSDSFPGNERTKYCLTSKVYTSVYIFHSKFSVFIKNLQKNKLINSGFDWFLNDDRFLLELSWPYLHSTIL